MRLRIQQSHPKTLEEVTRLTVALEAIQNADKQRDHRMTTQVRNIDVEDVNSSPFCIVDLQACIKELSSEIREMKVELDSLKRKRVERLLNRQDSKKCWICGSKEHLKKNCSKLKINRNWQGQQGRMQPRSTRISNNGS
ncbi:hypothetical protein ACJMK2_013667 [Sinanodonta woodiana]|uniref:CCHC-type domain-containing protein n=1 Tax=Sinanodonta woodiana TaxID=1069815 RepID=A0ABD3UZH0_SINWO